MAIVLTTDDTRREVFLKAEQAKIHTESILPELDNPASIGDVIAGKEYIDGAGAKQEGTLVVCDTIAETEYFGIAGTGVSLDIQSTADGSGKTMTLRETNLLPENIVVGSSIFGVPGNAKKLRVEAGAITPAESMSALGIPCSANPIAIFVSMAEASYNEVIASAADAIVYATATNGPLKIGADGETSEAYYAILNVHTSSLRNAMTQVAYTPYPNVSINAISKYLWYAGAEYIWKAYYWEDT